jgi:hypothetical protein
MILGADGVETVVNNQGSLCRLKGLRASSLDEYKQFAGD